MSFGAKLRALPLFSILSHSCGAVKVLKCILSWCKILSRLSRHTLRICCDCKAVHVSLYPYLPGFKLVVITGLECLLSNLCCHLYGLCSALGCAFCGSDWAVTHVPWKTYVRNCVSRSGILHDTYIIINPQTTMCVASIGLLKANAAPWTMCTGCNAKVLLHDCAGQLSKNIT